MLKDMIEKHTVRVPVSDRVNVVDMLTNENAQDQLKDLFVGMTTTCQELEKLEQAGEQLKNESGLVDYLASQGYENITTESGETVAKELWEKIKKAIAFLVDKFMEYFNKAKDFILELLDNNEKKVLSLIELIKNNNVTAPYTKILNLDSVSKKLPFKDLYKPNEYIETLDTFNHTINYLLDYKKITVGKTLMEKILNNIQANIISIKQGEYTTIEMEPEKAHLVIKTKSTNIVSHPLKVMEKEDILKVLNFLLKFIKENKTYLKSVRNNIDVLKKMEPSNDPDDIFGVNNIEHNISVLIRASKITLSSINTLVTDITFVMASYIKCY